jgi:molybdopterin-binding protein
MDEIVLVAVGSSSTPDYPWTGWPSRSIGCANRQRRKRVMQLSARNQLQGTITGILLGGVMAEVTVEVGGQELVSVVTRKSAESLGLSEGESVIVVIKATEVMLARE